MAPGTVEAFERFRELVLGNLLLQERLRQTPNRESFAALAVLLGSQHGLRFTVDDVAAALRSARLSAAAPAVDAVSAAELTGWVPSRVDWQHDRPEVEWSYVGDTRFVEPFFEATIARCARHPYVALFRRRTSMDVLTALDAGTRRVRPTGFIFHMSRCGSTLVAQMLATLAQCIVLSEPPPIDAIIGARFRDPSVTEERRVVWLRAMVSALGQPRTGQETRLFVKFDSWHTLDLPLIRRAFPEVPWIFLYREPIEVVASHLRQAGSQMVPGMLPAALFGLDAAAPLPAREHCVKVLAEICRGALLHLAESGLAINYLQLPDVVWSHVATHFRLDLSAGDRDRMSHTSQFNAKTPVLLFEDDRAAKQRSVPDGHRQLSDQELRPLYERLEACRRARRQVE